MVDYVGNRQSYLAASQPYLASGYCRKSDSSSASYLRKGDYTSYSAPKSDLVAAMPSVTIVSRASLC